MNAEPTSDEKIALSNELREAEERYLRVLDKISNMHILLKRPEKRTDGFVIIPAYQEKVAVFDACLLDRSRTKVHEATMWALRSIFPQTRIKLPEDVA